MCIIEHLVHRDDLRCHVCVVMGCTLNQYWHQAVMLEEPNGDHGHEPDTSAHGHGHTKNHIWDHVQEYMQERVP